MRTPHEAVAHDTDVEFLHELVPAVRVAHCEHEPENVGPGLGVVHDGIREHAAVPADMLEGARRMAAVIAHPRACVTHDIEFPVGVEWLTVAAGLIVRARAL